MAELAASTQSEKSQNGMQLIGKIKQGYVNKTASSSLYLLETITTQTTDKKKYKKINNMKDAEHEKSILITTYPTPLNPSYFPPTGRVEKMWMNHFFKLAFVPRSPHPSYTYNSG